MGKQAEVLGTMTCPHCGMSGGMRVTADRNGEPFGFCEANCDGQLRVGGKARRVEMFYQAHPEVRRPGAPPGESAAPVPPVVPAKADTTEGEEKKPRKSFSLGAL